MLRFALVGCGRIGERHAQLLASGQINDAHLVAVCDIDLEKAKKIGEKYQVAYFADMHDMMAKIAAQIDVLVVLTPSGLHAPHVIELAPYKKSIIVEKPMALTLADADAMIAACDKNDVRLFVVKQNRFNPPIIKLREAMEAGKFGKLVMGTVRVRWCRPQSYYDQDAWRGTVKYDRGVFANQASHHIDLLQWLMGDVESVFAKGKTALVDIEAEDTGVAILNFSNGALGLIEATTAVRPYNIEGSISILGEHGVVEIGGIAVNKMKIWKFVDETPEHEKFMIENAADSPPDVYGFGHKLYYDHVIDCLRSAKKTMLDGVEGRKTVKLLCMMYDSIQSHKELVIPNESPSVINMEEVA